MRLLKNPGSFRDPAGQVFNYDDRIIRVINKFGKERYDYIKNTNIISESINKNFLIPTKEVTEEFKDFKSDDNVYFLEHQKIDYISYPYEWSFYQLKSAALHHLNFQIFLIYRNTIIIDSSEFNIQFIENKTNFYRCLVIR